MARTVLKRRRFDDFDLPLAAMISSDLLGMDMDSHIGASSGMAVGVQKIAFRHYEIGLKAFRMRYCIRGKMKETSLFESLA
jgi:hypothetical protein